MRHFFTIIYISILLFLFSNCKLRNKWGGGNQYKFKQSYIEGNWDAEDLKCNGVSSNRKIVITIENGEFVGRKAPGEPGDDCVAAGGVIFRGKLPAKFDTTTTYTSKYQINSKWQVDTNMFVQDMNKITTNQYFVLKRSTPGKVNLYDTLWDRNYFVGDWSCTGYSCEGRNIVEQIRCKNEESQFQCIKSDANGDNCVTQNNLTFSGEIQDYLDTTNFITSTWVTGRPSAPNGGSTRSYIYIKGQDKFVSNEIQCTRISKYVPWVDPTTIVVPPVNPPHNNPVNKESSPLQPLYIVYPPSVIQVFQTSFFYSTWFVDGFICKGLIAALTVEISAGTDDTFTAVVTKGNDCLSNGKNFFRGTLPKILNSINFINVKVSFGLSDSDEKEYPLYIGGTNYLIIPKININLVKVVVVEKEVEKIKYVECGK